MQIPRQKNKSSKCKTEKKAHNSGHNTINSKHNWRQYLHFSYLQLRQVCTGVITVADVFSIKLKQVIESQELYV